VFKCAPKRSENDRSLEGGCPLDVASVEVDRDEDNRHLAQLRSLVTAMQHLVGHMVNLKFELYVFKILLTVAITK